MKIKNISMAIIAAAAMLAVCPAVHAQTDTNAPATATHARRGRGPTLESIDKAVTLTDDQKPKVKEALEQLQTTITGITADDSDRQAKMRSAREEFNKKMKEILTPEQYTKFQAMPRGGRRGGANGGGANSPAGT
jgi:Spy/CpxP family protein refolding chaperone